MPVCNIVYKAPLWTPPFFLGCFFFACEGVCFNVTSLCDLCSMCALKEWVEMWNNHGNSYEPLLPSLVRNCLCVFCWDLFRMPFIVFFILLLFWCFLRPTVHAKDIWLCLSGSKGGGRRWSESSETECFHPTAGEEKYFHHCKSERCDQTHHSDSDDDFMRLKCSPLPVFLPEDWTWWQSVFRYPCAYWDVWKLQVPAESLGLLQQLWGYKRRCHSGHQVRQECTQSTQNWIHYFDFNDYLDIPFTYGAWFHNVEMIERMKMTTSCCRIASSYCGSPDTCFNSQ